MLRRDTLRGGLLALSAVGLATVGYSASVSASDDSVPAELSGLCSKLAAALRSIGSEGCVAAAARLEASAVHRDVQLHLRGVGLTALGAERIADALRSLTSEESSKLVSVSFSYNDDIGDAGVVHLARALPAGLRELGFVDCQIQDMGGAALLDWARRATRLRMLCIEGNLFSAGLKTRFGDLPGTSSRLSVYV